MTVITYRTACRACKGTRLDYVFGLGTLRLSGFPRPDEPDPPPAPLTLLQCADCGLVQLQTSVARDELYREYHYRSGVNPKIAGALKDVADTARRHVTLEKGDHILDIGCNDGTLLDFFSGPYLHLIGVDPSDVGAEAVRGGSQRRTIIHDYWPLTQFSMEPVPCKVITSIACLYDVDDLSAFADAIRQWLHPEGVWIIEVADWRKQMIHGGFDTICHEHLTYWDRHTLSGWLSREGFRILAIDSVTTNGGSLRVVVQTHRDGETAVLWDNRNKLQPEDWDHFRFRIGTAKDLTLAWLTMMKDSAQLVLGYGASTKGNSLLQHFGIGPDLLPAIAERQPHKVGRVTSGTRIPIISEEEMRQRKPAALYALPWHLVDTFLAREPWAQFAVSLPTFALLGPGGRHVE